MNFEINNKVVNIFQQKVENELIMSKTVFKYSKNNFSFLFSFFVLYMSIIVNFSCNNNEKSTAIARAFKNELYWSDIEPFFKTANSKEDSANRVKKLVDNWLMQQIKLNAATNSINANDPDIEKKVTTYKNDLLIYYFEQNKITQLLDTNVQEKEMILFFNKNKENFHLSSNIVKLLFVKIKNEENLISKFKYLISNPLEKNKLKLLEMSNKYAENSFLDDQVWLNFDDIIKEVPIKTYDAKHFLENNKYVEIKEGPYIYLVNILAYQIKNTASNFEFEKENIKKVIWQNRKKDLLKQLENKLKKDAELKNEIESFVD